MTNSLTQNVPETSLFICNYCRSDAPDEGRYYKLTMYHADERNTGAGSCKYSARMILVPRCKKCFRKHKNYWGGRISLEVFAMLFVPVFFFLCFTAKFYPGGLALVFPDMEQLVYGTAISVIIAGVIAVVVEFLMRLMCGIKGPDKIENEPNVREMMRSGWSRRQR